MRRIIFGLLAACIAAPAIAAGMPQFHFTPEPRPAEAPKEYPLYPGVAPGSEGATQVEVWAKVEAPDGSSSVMTRNVTRPTYSVFPADPAKATGAAVILAPGGAFMSLSMQTEGWDEARWFAKHGVTAFVLKYRLDETPADTGAFMAAIGKRVGAVIAAGAENAPPISQPMAIADGQAMVRLVRRDAARWRIDPHRIGFVGFSAGAMTALSVTLADEPASRPDFVGLLYPPMNEVQAPADAPPLFVGLAEDDPLFGHMGFGLIRSWQKAGKPVELHFYQGGDHGFGSRHTGTTSEHWFDEFVWWMQAMKLGAR